MVTQSFYTPDKAAELIGCKEEEVMVYIKSGQLKAAFLSNIANYVITHADLVSFLKATRDFKTVSKMFTRRIILVDREPKVQDYVRLELGRQGFEIKVATTEKEVAFLVNEYQPDVICVHLGAVTRPKDPVKASLERARSVYKTYIILYHNYAASTTTTPQIADQIKNVNADATVVTDRGISPLVEAVRARFGLKSANTMVRPRPLG